MLPCAGMFTNASASRHCSPCRRREDKNSAVSAFSRIYLRFCMLARTLTVSQLGVLAVGCASRALGAVCVR